MATNIKLLRSLKKITKYFSHDSPKYSKLFILTF